MPGLLDGKIALVTGAGSGIGEATAIAMAEAGARIVTIDINIGAAVRTAKAAGESAVGFTCDVTDRAACDALAAKVREEIGPIAVLVNNAGIIRRAAAVDFSEADWNEVLRVNLTAPFFLSQAVARWWLTQGRAASPGNSRLKIVNVASLLSFQGGITVPAYAASKHGIVGVTKALANEWARERINVNAIAPGYIATENTRALREDAARNQAIQDRIPEGRWGTPEDVAGGCVFLASPGADYLNGVVLNIDGGWLAR